MSIMKISRSVLTLTAVALTATLTACGHVKRTELDTELSRIRDEMRDGDQQVAQSVNQLSQRVDGLESRIDALDRDLDALETDFQMTVERLETALRFNAPVFFAFDEATIREEDKPLLDRFSSVIAEYYPTALVTVEGFTDPAGSREYNLKLGQRRAAAVLDYLVESGGLSADRLRAVSYGEETQRLVASGHGPGSEGWENRRVVMVVDHGDASAARGLIASNR